MKTQPNKGRLLLTLGCICGLANAAGAAESGEIVELGEVLVTATRTDASLSAAPAAVTVVNAKNIETVNAKLVYAFSKLAKGTLALHNLLNNKAYSYFLLPSRNVTAEMDFSFYGYQT